MPKYLFLLSKNVSSLINFGLTLCIFFVFVIADGIPIKLRFLMLLYPVCCLIIFNIGVGLVLSALFVFFRDISYLYSIFTMLLMYLSAIFYQITIVPAKFRMFFYLNPLYCYIEYFRKIVLESKIPTAEFHLLCAFYAVVFLCLLHVRSMWHGDHRSERRFYPVYYR